jgi:hypothetical protein
MTDFAFNIAKGAAAEKARNDATKFGVLLLKTVESDGLMKDRATIADVVANSTEANFTNYARKVTLTATLTVDYTNDRVDIDLANQTWVSAGGALNNTLVKAIVFYDPDDDDATAVPISGLDFAGTTDGSNLVWNLDASGFYRAA